MGFLIGFPLFVVAVPDHDSKTLLQVVAAILDVPPAYGEILQQKVGVDWHHVTSRELSFEASPFIRSLLTLASTDSD